MYKKVWCTCEVVVLLIKPIDFFTFSLTSASLDLKVPIVVSQERVVILPSPPHHFLHVTLPGINPPSYQEKRPEFENNRYCSVLMIHMMKCRMTGTPTKGS